MRKLIYKIIEQSNTYGLEFITDRTPQWTEKQYIRHRSNITMQLVSNEETTEEEPISREVNLG
jgi:hypothetical protein|tara:strand:+ start:2007 stop:2195 length:189 start_codon:yes stop_codon:yes gene_type:complete